MWEIDQQIYQYNALSAVTSYDATVLGQDIKAWIIVLHMKTLKLVIETSIDVLSSKNQALCEYCILVVNV